MSSEFNKIRVGNSKFGRRVPSSEDTRTLHERIQYDGVLSSEDKTGERFEPEVPERVEHDTEELILKRGLVPVVWKLFGFLK